MKKSLLVLVAVLMSVVAMAQAPQKMTYQAVVRDNNGRLVCNGNVGVRITIVRGSETGAWVYSQTETVRTNDNGLFTTMIGGDAFEVIDWSNGPYYLKSEVDPDGGSNYILTTTQQMVSVPYALHAGTVDNLIGGVNVTENDPIFTAWDKDYNDLINKPTIPTNVSELANDAGYLTSFTETQVLSISSDTIFLTGGSYVKLPAGFSGDYNDLTNRPNFADSVSRIVNEYHLGDTIINYISQNGYVDSSYVINYNAQQGYVDTTYVTNYLNNSGAVTSESDPVFTAWNKDYNDLINKPNFADSVSRIVNEYHLGDTIINYISQNGYVDSNYVINYNTQQGYVDTSYVTNYISNGGAVTSESDPVFAAWDKDYNDLINRPSLADSVSQIVNEYHLGDTIINYISQNGYVDSSYVINYNTQQGYVDTSYVTNYINNGGAITSETDPVFTAWDKDYNDLINLPAIPTAVSELANDAGYLTSYTEVQSLGDVTTIGNAANSQLKAVSDPTEDLDAVNLRTLNLTINAVVANWTHRFDSITHRYDSIMHNVDSIIHYQDSVIDTLSSLLAELGATAGDTTAVECDRFNWYGTEYTVSGDYRHRLTNVAGFDSVLIMHLTINHGTHNAESQTACDSYTWHGNDYTASGTYTYDYTNGVGCASTDTLHLTINVSTAATDTHTECDSYTWIDGNTYTSSNNTATHTLTNIAGCDSVVTLNLTLNYGTHNAESHTVADSYTWHETTYTESGDYTNSYTNAAGCASVDTLHLTIDIGVQGFDENGASNAVFTVAEGRTVRFSKGNLQYTTTGTHTVSGGNTETGTWRFAEHQYDYIGEDNANISSSYTGWIDLFGWGTSGWNSGADAYQPWDTIHGGGGLYLCGISTNNLTGTYAQADWGVYNAISNGGNQPGTWRVLTIYEWARLINSRSASTVGGTANARYANATVNGTNGVIIFPDTFTLPAGLAVTNINTSTSFSGNTYTTSQWNQLESAGCIFLPAAGDRLGTNVHDPGSVGYYWSSTYSDNHSAWYKFFNEGYFGEFKIAPGTGRSVRLVKDVE